MKEAIEIAIEYNGPVYIRVARDVVPDVEFDGEPEIGKSTKKLISDLYLLALFYANFLNKTF